MASLEGFAAAADRVHPPNLPLGIEAQLLEFAVHDDAAAVLLNFARGSFPHHAGVAARITKRFDQGLGGIPPCGLTPKERRKPSLSALKRSSPLILCAAQSAEISSQSMPQTFSV